MGLRKNIINGINFLFDNAKLVTMIALIFLTVVDISNLNEFTINAFSIKAFPLGKIVYYIGVILALIFGVFGTDKEIEIKSIEKELSLKSKNLKELEETLVQVVEENQELFNSYLKQVFANLNFTHEERISVYYATDEGFKLIGRSCENPELVKPGRLSYTKNEGFISLGCKRGEFFIEQLPDFATNNGDDYHEEVNKHNYIAKGVLRKIRMKSRTYFVYRMNGYDGNATAVMVAESLKPDGLNRLEIVNKINEVKQSLVHFIEKNHSVNVVDTAKNGNFASNIGF